MTLDELHPDLKRKYKSSLTSGVQQLDHPKLKDIWFVVPPPPPKAMPSNLATKLLSQGTETFFQQPLLSEASEVDRLISYLFLRREALQSSRIEGTLSTIEHVLTPGEIFDDYKAKSEGASVRGYAHALENEIIRSQSQKIQIFNLDLLRRLHAETMKYDPHFKGIPGTFREPGKSGEIVWIRGQTHLPEDSIYNPPPAAHVARCLRETMSWFSDSNLNELGTAGIGLPLIARIALGHAHFEAIHPFHDGNGRVGRMLITLQMTCQNRLPLYLSGFIEEDKQSYYRALQEAQKKLNYSPIIEFFSAGIISASAEAKISKQKIESLPLLWRSRAKFRRGSAAEKALDWMRSHPIFTTKVLQRELKTSAQTANTAVELLLSAKIVRERTGFERNRVFAAEEVISILSRRFGSDPDVALEGAMQLLHLNK